ncbi:U6 snRNA-associated Sm-like protein, putative [Candida maltosa Xu316]|uniref:LSM complex subunit LSM4 n=1 Tax=Candida maltosa (strain Xu316) TaxID=1245528 RepID=M3HIW5_CANMX|nr:U6 snRNA-associated Sm-like protein, putative [Candida maltosa Xu316]
MLPLYLLTAAKNKPVLIELKTGETYNGNLTNCDSWMNLTLHDVIQTNPQGDAFMKIPEVYIRGMHIKYLRIPDDIMAYAKEQSMINMENRNRYQRRRTGGGDQRRYNNNNNSNSNSGNYHNHHHHHNSNNNRQQQQSQQQSQGGYARR